MYSYYINHSKNGTKNSCSLSIQSLFNSSLVSSSFPVLACQRVNPSLPLSLSLSQSCNRSLILLPGPLFRTQRKEMTARRTEKDSQMEKAATCWLVIWHPTCSGLLTTVYKILLESMISFKKIMILPLFHCCLFLLQYNNSVTTLPLFHLGNLRDTLAGVCPG